MAATIRDVRGAQDHAWSVSTDAAPPSACCTIEPVIVLTAFLVLVFVYSLLSRRLENTALTAPIFFTLGGALLLALPVDQARLLADRESLLVIAELGLVMLLFTDASPHPPPGAGWQLATCRSVC